MRFERRIKDATEWEPVDAALVMRSIGSHYRDVGQVLDTRCLPGPKL